MLFIPDSTWCVCTLVLACLCVVPMQIGQVISQDHSGTDSDDPHGGVPMGQPNEVCDDAKANVEIDWDPSSTEEYTCDEERTEKAKSGLHYYHCDQQAKRPVHLCYPEVITYTEDLPTSGRHRPLWPRYGEYEYLPVQRWLHSLEHGAVVFLYHPCTDPEQIEMFKSVARGCLRRHIISPYKKMPPDMNFALLTWKCKMLLSDVQITQMVEFIHSRALHAPEANTYKDGQYELGLIRPAKMVSDMKESQLCPGLPMMSNTVEEIKAHSQARKAHSEEAQKRLAHVMADFLGVDSYP